jgi:cytochrome c oxidase accessory protein FixG
MNDKIPLNEWAPAEVSELDLYQKREKIYTRKIEGFYQRIRLFTGWPLLLGYFFLPWIDWFGRQSVLFDLPARKFHILHMTFWPQDMSLLGLVLIICAYSLFLVTMIAGRVWCGFTCPQTVWTSIFMWIEQSVEGTRNQRIKLDKSPLSGSKIRKKMLKHSLWLGFAFLTGFTFVGYFTPIKSLAYDFAMLEVNLTALFWVLFFTFATFGNSGWMREQVCKYMCPYARFQSAMFDKDSLIVSYDKKRGEQRGSRKRDADPAQLGLGDCIDCQLCVQVCPTGIDIRNGLQYECIACGLCADACDSVMKKMAYPENLIAFTTEHSLEGEKVKLLRPKVLIYSAALFLIIGFFIWRVASIDAVELGVVRDRMQVTSQSINGKIENRYMLKIANKTDSAQQYRISVSGLAAFQLAGVSQAVVQAGEVESLRLRVLVDEDTLTKTVSNVVFKVQTDDGKTYTHDSRFIGLMP